MSCHQSPTISFFSILCSIRCVFVIFWLTSVNIMFSFKFNFVFRNLTFCQWFLNTMGGFYLKIQFSKQCCVLTFFYRRLYIRHVFLNSRHSCALIAFMPRHSFAALIWVDATVFFCILGTMLNAIMVYFLQLYEICVTTMNWSCWRHRLFVLETSSSSCWTQNMLSGLKHVSKFSFIDLFMKMFVSRWTTAFVWGYHWQLSNPISFYFERPQYLLSRSSIPRVCISIILTMKTILLMINVAVVAENLK